MLASCSDRRILVIFAAFILVLLTKADKVSNSFELVVGMDEDNIIP